MSKEIIHRYW